MNAAARIHRKTRETEISLTLDLDGSGKTELKTGVPFLEHMLDLFAKHGLFDLRVKRKGMFISTTTIRWKTSPSASGPPCAEALGDKAGIRRYGHAVIPMDESLGQVAVDLSESLPLGVSGRVSRAAGGNL